MPWPPPTPRGPNLKTVSCKNDRRCRRGVGRQKGDPRWGSTGASIELGIARIVRAKQLGSIEPREVSMPSRRELLTQSGRLGAMMVTLGLLQWPGAARAQSYNAVAFDAKTMPDLTRALDMQSPVESSDVTLTIADVAENGAVVPVSASTTLPGVRRMLLLVEKNPSMLSAMFEVTDAVEASFSTRLKMGQSSTVFAVAITADDRTLYAAKDVKVTIGGCGG
jgi:sulfur-oxidizing protein SoxY